jgi:hypothetical protein
MLKLAADLRLLDESTHQLGLVLVGPEHDFHGKLAPEVDITTAKDGTHSASGDLAEELVAPGQFAGRRQIGNGVIVVGRGAELHREIAQPDAQVIDTGPGIAFRDAVIPRLRRDRVCRAIGVRPGVVSVVATQTLLQ